MKRMFLYLALVLMTVSVYSCSKDEPDLGGTQPGTETEEGGGGGHGNTINPIMTDFNDINQLYGTWKANQVMLSGEWYELTYPRIIVFKKDGTFSYTDETSSFKGTYTYIDSTAVCTRNDTLPIVADRYRFKFFPYNNNYVRMEMKEVGFGVTLVLDFLVQKTANE